MLPLTLDFIKFNWHMHSIVTNKILCLIVRHGVQLENKPIKEKDAVFVG